MEHLAPKGTYRNPLNKPCWKTCMSCGRCANKGTRPDCTGCSGRVDEYGQKVPHIDDYCRCAEGILQLVAKNGKLYQVRMTNNPFGGSVKTDNKTEDERDYESYLAQKREHLDDSSWDGVVFDDGTSTQDWSNRARE